ncbi:SGNH/GDSL hydrolase family protein [Priestia flexa]|uniref:SGNH/GDSL hydrolase family protein n=1 Tax=Priestia flexa TaxID=86664 RepID=UPI000473F1AD|nr:SGNH/GDSL hydrolase family protein [Priestia flexa]
MKLSFDRLTNALVANFRNTLNKFIGEVEENFTETVRDVNQAKTDASAAVAKADEAKGKAESVQEQFNQVVIEGDSSVEAAQARVDAKNVAQPTLKARLDKDYNEVTAQLAQKLQKGDVSVSDINKNKGKFDQTYMTEEFLQQIAGNTPINAVPADNSITPKKTTFMVASENLIDPSKRSDGYNLNFSWNTQYSLNTDASMTAYTESFPTVNGEVIYSNAPGRLVWYTSSDNVSGTAAFSWDSSLGLYKATVGGGVKSRVDGYISNINVNGGYWFVCRSALYSGSKSKYGTSKLSDIVDSNVFSKKTELEVVKTDVSLLKTPTNSTTFFVPHYLYCYESNKSSKWIPKHNVMIARNPNSFYIDSTAGWGFLRDWERIKTQDADIISLKTAIGGASVYSKQYARRSVNPATKTNPSTQKNVLLIGDSYSDAGYIPCDIKKQLTDYGFNNFNFIGTKTDTINGVTTLNEGRGGYTIDDFTKATDSGGRGVTYPNPFLNNGVVSFLNYMSRNNFSGNLDYAIVELGVNNVVALGNDPTTIKNKMQGLIDLILSSYPNCKIFIVGLVMISKINGTTDCVYHNSLVLNINKAYEELCESSSYASNCVYVDTAVFFDSEYGFPYENKPYRGSSEQRKVQTDWLHPSEAGYYMMTDTISSAFIYHM